MLVKAGIAGLLQLIDCFFFFSGLIALIDYCSFRFGLISLIDCVLMKQMQHFRGSVEAFHVKTVDTTGAGDSFVGALLAKIVDDQSILEVSIIIILKKNNKYYGFDPYAC